MTLFRINFSWKSNFLFNSIIGKTRSEWIKQSTVIINNIKKCERERLNNKESWFRESVWERERTKRGKFNIVNVDFPLGHQSFLFFSVPFLFLIDESLKEPLMPPHKLFYKTYASGKST